MAFEGWVGELAALRTVGIAAGLAALLGMERELANKPAGLRTHILVGASAALLIVTSHTAVADFASQQGGGAVSADPIRVVQAVVVGISFLGAGTILQRRDASIEGLTTAASILMTAAIGMTVALDRVPLAVMVTVGSVLVLHLLARVERRIEPEPSPPRAPPPDEARAPERRPGSPLPGAPPGSQ